MTAATLRLIVNARIATGDPRRPWADALLAEGVKVLAVGRSPELRKLAKGREVEIIDARGAEVHPDGSPLLAHQRGAE